MTKLLGDGILNEKQEEAKRELCSRIYGELPPKPIHLDCRIDYSDPSFAAGKATKNGYSLIADLGEKKAIINVTEVIPSRGSNFPTIINFTAEDDIPNRYLPAEELIDRGYAIFSLRMKDISENDGDFKSGISGYIARIRRKRNAAGKMAVWAWAILRVVEQVLALNYVNKDAVAVAGHGICARTAMLAAGFDQRVKFIIANGIASSPFPYSEKMPKSGMTVHDHPHLYCPAFADAPFGDEYSALLSLCAPRCIMVGSAAEGIGLDIEDEYSYLRALSDGFYHPLGLIGLSEEKNLLTAEYDTPRGEIHYHIRPGVDYFSREDWNTYLDFIDNKISKKTLFKNEYLYF